MNVEIKEKTHAYFHLLISLFLLFETQIDRFIPAFNYELVGSVSAFAHLWPWNR